MKLRIAVLLLFAVTQAAGDEDQEPWFNHKKHAGLKLECTYCHSGATKSPKAGMPAAQQCLLCHKTLPATTDVLRKLVKLPPDAKPFHAEYDTLPDFVIFSHVRHARGKLACAACHGDVGRKDQMEPALAMNMKACIDCHKVHRAKVVCQLCHRLGE